ncbi:MAG TPA: FAD-dependent oxidoreductase [Longimicrobiales bacterium]|nr:FAD-dependent oxidoreductase [Longimicrobiales bacterium]
MAMDRRDFLKSAGVLAAVPTALPDMLAAQRAPGVGTRAADVVVIGAGAWGGWTALHLRELGANVTLVDQYGAGNARATSGDETRGVRTAYGPREPWSRWAHEAIGRWRAWDAEWGRELGMQLFFPTGDLIMRPEWDTFLEDTRAVWDRIGIRYEVLTPDEVRYRYPVIDTEGMQAAVFENDAGVARARRSCEAVAEVFRRRGGRIMHAHAALGVRADGRAESVRLTPGDALRADAFVFACGPWLPRALPDAMNARLRTPMGSVYYFGVPAQDQRYTFPNMPSWNFPGVTGWAALPPDHRGFRVRTGGAGSEQDPDLSSRWVDEQYHERARTFLAQRFPLMKDAPIVQTHACHYEFSVTRNFIIDRHPGLDNVWIAGAGNAEGFKMGPVVGEYIAHRVLGMPTDAALDEDFKLSAEVFPPPEPPPPA